MNDLKVLTLQYQEECILSRIEELKAELKQPSNKEKKSELLGDLAYYKEELSLIQKKIEGIANS